MVEKNKPAERVFSVVIERPREVVWEALTTIGSRQSFYFDSVLHGEMRPGGALSYRSADGRHTFIEGRVLEVRAPERLVHTFAFTDLSEPPGTVTFVLTPEGEGTRLELHHHGLEQAPKTRGRVTRGWPQILGNLRSWLTRGRLPWGSRVQYCLMGLLVPLMSRRAAS